jgi:xanthine dehydrogenase accessory factor
MMRRSERRIFNTAGGTQVAVDRHDGIINDEIVYEEIVKLKKRGEPGVLITVVQKEGSGPAPIGTKLLYCESGRSVGTVGGGELEHEALRKAGQSIHEKRSFLQSYSLSQQPQPPGRQAHPLGEEARIVEAEKLGMLCGGTATLFFEYIAAGTGLYLFGGGHIGRALIRHLEHQSFNITVIENRRETLDSIPEEVRHLKKVLTEEYVDGLGDMKIEEDAYIVIATYSHELDYRILAGIYAAGCRPVYIGVVASRRKAAAMVDRLREELGSDLDLRNLYMPVGLDIGGQSPDEIAFSILAEIQALRHRKEGHKHLREDWNAP